MIRLRWEILKRDYGTQANFAKKVGLTRNAISNLATGSSGSFHSLNKICTALGCQPGDIIEYVPGGEE